MGGRLRNGGAILALAFLASAACLVLGNKQRMRELLEASINYISAQGDNAILAYMAFTFVGVICCVPTTLMEFAGGFLFAARYGLWTTWLLTSAAKFAANIVSVWLARHVLRDLVVRNFVEKYEVLRLVSTAVREEPFKMAFLVRGSMAPLSVKNYGLGALDLDYLPIAAASLIFAPFYAYQNLYLGSACQDLKEVFSPRRPSADAAAGGGDDWTSTVKALIPVLFNVALVLCVVRAVRFQIRKTRSSMEAALKQKALEKVE